MFRLLIKIFYCGLCLCGVPKHSFSKPLITASEPPVHGVFDIQCDLEYSEHTLSGIVQDLQKRYGFEIYSDVSLSDVHFSLEGDSDGVDSFIFELCQQNDVYLDQTHIKNESWERWVGLSGKEEDIDNVLDILLNKFSIKNIERNDKIRINLHGRQMPYGEVIYHLARKSGLGICFRGRTLGLLRHDRRLLAYTKAQPFHIYLSKESTTMKLVIDLVYGPDFLIEDNSEIELRNIVLFSNGKTIPLSGYNRTAEQSTRYPGRIEWVSDDPVDWNETIAVKGTVHGRLLHREYQVDNLQSDSAINAHGVSVKVRKSSDGLDHKSVFGVYWMPSRVEGDWMCVEIETRGLLNEDEKKFVRKIESERLQGKQPSQEVLDKYESLVKEKMSILRVASIGKPVTKEQSDEFWDSVFGGSLPATVVEETNFLHKYEGIDSIIYYHGMNATKVFFDSDQDEVIFPIGIHIREYQPAKIEFDISSVFSVDCDN